MKVAICISGIPRGNARKNINLMKEKFGTNDVFFLTWTGQEEAFKKVLPDEKFWTHEEPEMHYHPMMDVAEKFMPPVLKAWKLREECFMKGAMRERMLHHTKQILAHAYLLDQLPEEYDMIIRSRFDTYLSSAVNFNPFIEESYSRGVAMGFGTRTSRHRNIDVIAEVPKIWPDRHKMDASISQDWGGYIMDPLILHPRNLFDTEMTKEYHRTKRLLPAEYGWYQILSQPYNDSHDCYYGGAQIEKYSHQTGGK